MHPSYEFFIPGVPPVSFLDECQFLLREGSSGDIFSNEMPVVTEVSCIQSMKRQVSIVRGCSSSGCQGKVTSVVAQLRKFGYFGYTFAVNLMLSDQCSCGVSKTNISFAGNNKVCIFIFLFEYCGTEYFSRCSHFKQTQRLLQ